MGDDFSRMDLFRCQPCESINIVSDEDVLGASIFRKEGCWIIDLLVMVKGLTLVVTSKVGRP